MPSSYWSLVYLMSTVYVEQITLNQTSLFIKPTPLWLYQTGPTSLFIKEPTPLYQTGPTSLFIKEPTPLYQTGPTSLFIKEPTPLYQTGPTSLFIKEPTPLDPTGPTSLFIKEPTPLDQTEVSYVPGSTISLGELCSWVSYIPG